MNRSAHGFIDGLTLIRDAIDGASFYNSSESASFCLRRRLTESERDTLYELGFTDYSEAPASSVRPQIVAYICFCGF